jgi:hypothetical protein
MGLFGEDGRLRKLKGSVLFAPDFPKRARFTHAQWIALDADAQRASHEPSLVAIRRVKRYQELAGLVSELGRAKVAEAVPVLAMLWSDCALQPVRTAAGHALRHIGTAEAREALVALIEDADHLSVFMGVRALFDADPATAFERCAAYFDPDRIAQPGGVVIPAEILRTFAPSSLVSKQGAMVPQWTEPRAPQWLRDDPRWLRLCVDLRRDSALGDVARDVLRHADPQQVTAAIAAAQLREKPQTIRATSRAAGDLVSRYRAGEHEAVWIQLRSCEAIDGDLRDEANAVAIETMKRVASCADLLAERLDALGWKPLYLSMRTAPAPDDRQVFRRIEEFAGAPLPPSLHAFWEVVGGINFIWNYELDEDHPDLCAQLEIEDLDPLCVDPAGSVGWQFDEWEDQRKGVDPELWDPLELSLSPDFLHKANISGGPPYGIELPFLGADPIFANEAHGLPFVDYLRLSIRWGGFPGLSAFAENPEVIRFVEAMTKDVEPF